MRRKSVKVRTSFERDRRRGLVTCACLSAILAAAVIAGGTVAKLSGASSFNSGREMAYWTRPAHCDRARSCSYRSKAMSVAGA